MKIQRVLLHIIFIFTVFMLNIIIAISDSHVDNPIINKEGKVTKPAIDVTKIDYASNYHPFEYTPHNLNVGQYFDTPSSMDEDMGDVEATVRKYGSVDNYREAHQSVWHKNWLVIIVIVIAVVFIFIINQLVTKNKL